nr:putative ribonuclease H-like domain-containing protein [Tanacetum cinerariifolium]
ENSFSDAEDEGIFDSGCSRSMTGNKERLDNFQEFQGGKVTFGGDESMVILRVPRKHNLYTINLNNLCPRGNLACLVVHASVDESVKWYRRMDQSFKPFGCHLTILNISDHLGKFDGKADEGYIVGYSASNKAYRVYNVPNKRVEETMNLRFLEAKPNVQGLGHEWYFDLDYLTDTLGYKHVQANQSIGTQGAVTNSVDTSSDEVDDSPLHSADEIFQKELTRLKGQAQRATSDAKSLGLGFANDAQELQSQASAKTVPPGCIPVSTCNVPVPPGSLPIPTGSIPVPTGNTLVSTDNVPVHTSNLGNHDSSHGNFSSSSYDDEFGAALNNLVSTVEVSLVATTRINTVYPQSLINRDPTSAVQTRSKALEDLSWVDAMQEEMQKFKFHNVWVLVDLPEGKYAIGTKWILKNKRDAKGIIFRNKARLVAQGHRQEKGIDYDEVFVPVARIEAIRLFLAFASYMGF